MKQQLEIKIEGNDICDLEYAIDEVRRLVSEGYKEGFNSNDTGSFHFDIGR